MNNYCIYKHTSPNGKVYIGQTNDIKRRWGRNGKEYENSPCFYNAILKYNWENFQHEIIEDNLTKEEANKKEKYYINKYHAKDPNYGYNLADGGDGGNNKETIYVNMYDLKGNFIKSFESAAAAARELNTDRTHITACCKKRQKTCCGYMWSYSNEELDLNYINNNARSKNNGKSKSVKVTEIETNISNIFHSRAEAIRFYGFSKSGFSECLNKKTDSIRIYLKKYIIEEVNNE